MEWAGAAERDQREAPRIVTTADRDRADRAGHVVVGDLHDAGRRLVGIELQRTRDARVDRRLRRARVERKLTTEQRRRNASEDQASVTVGSVPPRR